MSRYIRVDYTEDVELEFDRDNINEIMRQFKNWNDKNHRYASEDVEKLEDALEMLNDYPRTFTVDAEVDEVEISDDEIDEAYKDIHSFDKDGTYEDDYEDAKEEIHKKAMALEAKNVCLFQKLERLSYGYGNPEPLTKSEIKIICDILHQRL